MNIKHHKASVALLVSGFFLAATPAYSSDLGTTELSSDIEIDRQYSQISLIKPEGFNNTVDIYQSGHYNNAKTLQNGTKNRGNIIQKNGGHDARILQSGGYLGANIIQNGYGHDAIIEQNGYNKEAAIIQYGSYGNANIQQLGTSHSTSLSVTQYANGSASIKILQQ